MIPIKHPTSNFLLSEPEDTGTGILLNCNPLYVTVDVIDSDIPVIISYWKPDSRELEQLFDGGTVKLTVFGQTMPPVMLETVKQVSFEPQARSN